VITADPFSGLFGSVLLGSVMCELPMRTFEGSSNGFLQAGYHFQCLLGHLTPQADLGSHGRLILN